MANTNPAHIVLTNVRLSYTHLDQPYSQSSDNTPKYSAVVLVPKSDPANRAKIDAAIRAATEKARVKYGQAFPAQPKISVHDGDGVRPSDGQPFGEECRGCWVFTASSKTRPSIVDGNLQPILDPTQLYSGIYANVGVTFFGYNAPQNKGIGVALDNVQKVSDGEPLGGARASAEDDFAALLQAQQQAASGQPVNPCPLPYPNGAPYGQPVQQPVYPGQAFSVPQVNPITGQPL